MKDSSRSVADCFCALRQNLSQIQLSCLVTLASSALAPNLRHRVVPGPTQREQASDALHSR